MKGVPAFVFCRNLTGGVGAGLPLFQLLKFPGLTPSVLYPSGETAVLKGSRTGEGAWRGVPWHAVILERVTEVCTPLGNIGLPISG